MNIKYNNLLNNKVNIFYNNLYNNKVIYLIKQYYM